jgi:hypothetical protein
MAIATVSLVSLVVSVECWGAAANAEVAASSAIVRARARVFAIRVM